MAEPWYYTIDRHVEGDLFAQDYVIGLASKRSKIQRIQLQVAVAADDGGNTTVSASIQFKKRLAATPATTANLTSAQSLDEADIDADKTVTPTINGTDAAKTFAVGDCLFGTYIAQVGDEEIIQASGLKVQALMRLLAN